MELNSSFLLSLPLSPGSGTMYLNTIFLIVFLKLRLKNAETIENIKLNFTFTYPACPDRPCLLDHQ